jgi:hypothetical protein
MFKKTNAGFSAGAEDAGRSASGRKPEAKIFLNL